MSMPTLTFNEKFEYTIYLFRKGRRIFHVFRQHWLSFHEVDQENGRDMLYYLIAHEIFGGHDTVISLNKEEFEILQLENNRPVNEAANFKKALSIYIKTFAREWSSPRRTREDAKLILALRTL